MRRSFSPVVAILLSTAAAAATPGADKPVVGPVPAWVHPAQIPVDGDKPDQGAVRLLLLDQQSRLEANGGEYYSETMLRVQTPQGLSQLGTITFPWKPDTGTLTVHKLQIIRDGKVIDLLGKGDGITVLRRENGLEYAMLDGVLTAVIQPEGLQVGDILDMATTIKSSDPAMGGNSEAYLFGPTGGRTAHLRLRALWDDHLPVRWREGEGLPPVKERKAGGVTELSLAADDMEPLITPKGAPARFELNRYVQATSLKSWNALSALFAPLYVKAATLKPDSPLKAEIDRIAAASPDPVKRAEAALALTQDKLRYVFLGMNDGNLVPADADLSWQRRFADCKGKTAFLLALLHGLGIQAEPAIVSVRNGDGLDQRLPMVGLFDHVIVRAVIGGRIYWLDGTRTGDLHLADIEVPAFHFALPLRSSGAGLEPLVVPPPAKPRVEYSFKLDMTSGITQPLPFHVEELMRGDDALRVHLQLDTMAQQEREQALRDFFVGEYDDVEPKSFSATWDPAAGEEKLVMDGLARHDWKWSYEADRSRLGWQADFARPTGIHRDAPYAVAYPLYSVVRETILLPNEGRGFLSNPADVDRTIAGIEFHRKAKLDGGTYTIETSMRAVAPEFPASEAPAAQEALRDLYKQQALLTTGPAYQPTKQELAAFLASDPKTAQEFIQRAHARTVNNDFAGAIADLDRALALDPQARGIRASRASLLWKKGRGDEAIADLRQAIAEAPDQISLRMGLAYFLLQRGQLADAQTELDRALALDPTNGAALEGRAEVHRMAGRYEQALADAAAALKTLPHQVEIYQTRINAYMGLQQHDKALAEAQAAVAANPQSDFAHVLLGATYMKLDREQEGMAEFDRAIAIKPTVEAYLTRANLRPAGDIAGKRADVAAALKLDPSRQEAYELSARVGLLAHDYPAVIDGATAGLARNPDDFNLMVSRAIAYEATGRKSEAAKDYSAARATVGTDGSRLNNLCWDKAIYNAALASALEDCDAALRQMPDAPMTLDSRGFVLFRLGRYQDAIESYDHALKLRPESAPSLYVRGLAKRRLGRTAEGDADVAAAKKLDDTVEKDFADYGVTG